MSVYSFDGDDIDMHPLLIKSSQNVQLEDSSDDFVPPKHILKCAKQQNKRAFRAALSSNDVLIQLNSNQRMRPTPEPQNIGKTLLPLKDNKEASCTATGFRPILRQTNSESDLDARLSEVYRSPRIYLSVKRRHRETPAYFNKLSDEVILSIFQYLPKSSLVRCSKVCRRWARLSKHSTLWKRIDLGAKRIESSSVHRLINLGVQVMRLAKAEIREDFIDFARVSACRLQFLDLSMVNAEHPTIIRDILSRCRLLQGLSLENIDLGTDIESCISVGRNSNLKMLNLATCHNLTAAGVAQILSGCQKLTELNLAWTSLEGKGVRTACQMLPDTLLRLNFAGCRFNTMKDEDVANITECCPNLIELDLSDCTDITSKSLKIIAEALPSLEILCSSRCYSVEPMSYIYYCKHLKELNIFSTIKEECMPTLVRTLKNVAINRNMFSTVARPTVGIRRTSIWQQRTRDE